MAASTPTPASAQFDFTRRKRWQDILVTELAGCLSIVLSVHGKILFCTRSVRELLGYRETDWVDTQLTDYLHESDAAAFPWQLDQTLRTLSESDSVVRFCEKPRANAVSPSYKSMELRALPYGPDATQPCSCIVVTCRPYPTKYMDVYQSIIDLKLENERLTKALASQDTSGNEQVAGTVQAGWRPPSPPFTRYPPSTLPPYMQPSHGVPEMTNLNELLPLDFHPGFSTLPPTTLPVPGPSVTTSDSLVAPVVHVQRSATMDGDHYEQPKKKRRVMKQLVCADCGRTDSPEWRKGPLGPKTLCNACGLRYSKKKNEAAAGAGPSTLP